MAEKHLSRIYGKRSNHIENSQINWLYLYLYS